MVPYRKESIKYSTDVQMIVYVFFVHSMWLCCIYCRHVKLGV